MTATVLNYPVRFADCEGGEPTLEEMIFQYYHRYLLHDEAVLAARAYCGQIKVAESITKLFFIKSILKNIDLPEGVTTDSVLTQAASQILTSILKDRGIKKEAAPPPPPPPPPQTSEPKDGPHVKVFRSFEELIDYLDDKMTDTPKT